MVVGTVFFFQLLQVPFGGRRGLRGGERGGLKDNSGEGRGGDFSVSGGLKCVEGSVDKAFEICSRIHEVWSCVQKSSIQLKVAKR